jgi:homoserine kinase
MAGDGAAAARLGVRVPASSANLGSGYDVLAVALDLHLRIATAPFDGRRIVAAGEGADEVPGDDGNLVWRSVIAFCEVYGADVPDVTLHCDNPIPLERGMGSSAAAVVAGLTLARRLTGVAVADQDVIDLATQLEGHPDNVAAALLGGVVVAGTTGRSRRFEPTRSLRPLLCIPGERASTATTRDLVPHQVPLATTVATARRTALVLAGLAGMAAWDPTAMRDDVHEPPRLEVMAPSRALVDAARAAGLGACLSGAGPSVLVVVDDDDRVTAGWLAEIAGEAWRIAELRWDRAGARVDELVDRPA